MNINIYLEDTVAKTLGQCAKRSGSSRNAIIREAIKEWIQHHEVKKWPASILKFNGMQAFPSFESYRDNLLPPSEDPLA
jgi:hypothetical protein